jgi:hypothetical protein
MSEEQNSSQVRLISCTVSKPDGSGTKQLGPDMVGLFKLYESLLSPFVTASLVISDSANFINNFPLQGGEIFDIKVKTAFDDAPTEYKFSLWKIGNRIVKNKSQVYTIGLVSTEAIRNETVRVYRKLENNPESIVVDLLRNELKTDKEIYAEPSKFDVKLTGNRMRPFDLISKLLNVSVSKKTDYSSTSSTKSAPSTQKIKGSAGFFFWETVRGYNFFSVDSLCDEPGGKFVSEKINSKSWGPYVETIANRDGIDQRFIISNAEVESEIDLFTSMRKGKYSSLLVFFNYSTGQYEEYTYNIQDSYDNMSHLGGQNNVNVVKVESDKDLAEFPTRMMTVLLDHETWYNEPGVASPEPKDGSTSPTKFADWQKYYTAQGIARKELLKNQEVTLVIPGNQKICAGDKIDIRLVSKLPDELAKKEPYDTESSGVYLIKDVTHTYNFVNGTTGTIKTSLRLFRDSYGMKDTPSNRGN